jgi:histone H3/H4
MRRDPLFSKQHNFSTLHPIYVLYTAMDSILSPFAQTKYGGNWDTPARAKIRALATLGICQIEIHHMTNIPQPTISRILKEHGSRRSRKGRQYKLNLISKRETRRIIRYLSKSFYTRSLSFDCIKADCYINTSTSTIQRALKHAGYRRCVACPRPFITLKQARARLAFARRYRW